MKKKYSSFNVIQLLLMLLVLLGAAFSLEITRDPLRTSLTVTPSPKTRKTLTAATSSSSPSSIPKGDLLEETPHLSSNITNYVPFNQAVTNVFLHIVFPTLERTLDLDTGYCAGITKLRSMIHPDEWKYFEEHYEALAREVASQLQRILAINARTPEVKKLYLNVVHIASKYATEIPLKFQVMLQFIGNIGRRPLQGDYYNLRPKTEHLSLKMITGELITAESNIALHRALWARQSPKLPPYMGIGPAEEYLTRLPYLMEFDKPYFLDSKMHVTYITRLRQEEGEIFVLFDSNKGESTVRDPALLYEALAYLHAPNYDNALKLYLSLTPSFTTPIDGTKKFEYHPPSDKNQAFPYLLKAAERGDIRTVKEILKVHPDLLNEELIRGTMHVTALTRAASFGQLEMVKMLHAEYGAKIDPYFSLGFAQASGDTETIKYLQTAINTMPFKGSATKNEDDSLDRTTTHSEL